MGRRVIDAEPLTSIENGVLILAKWCCGIPWPVDPLNGDWMPGVIAGLS